MALRRIAVMMWDGSGHTASVMRGIAQYAVAHGPWEFSVRFPGLSVLAVHELPLDGIIAPLRNEEYARIFRGRPTPIVNFSGRLRDPGVPTVRVDDEAAGRIAAEHLLERGFKRFAFCGFPNADFSDLRGRGFAETVRNAGYDCDVYQPAATVLSEWTWEQQQADLARWIGTLERPVGIMGCNDDRAWQVAEACHSCGIRIPEEVSLVGVDNDELRCEFSTPPLSSVTIPAERIGYEAAALLDRLIDGGKPPAKPVLIQPQGVVARRSSETMAVDDEDVANACRFIHQHITEPFGIGDVARDGGVSQSDLDMKFRLRLGHTLEAEILRARIERGERILAETDMDLSKVATAAGFNAPARFSALLRRKVGLTPRAYREKFRLRGN